MDFFLGISLALKHRVFRREHMAVAQELFAQLAAVRDEITSRDPSTGMVDQ
jgi:hypothetical protein